MKEIAQYTVDFLQRYYIPFDKVEYDYNSITFNNRSYCGTTLEEFEDFYLYNYKKEIKLFNKEHRIKTKKYYLNYLKNDLLVPDKVKIQIYKSQSIFNSDVCIFYSTNGGLKHLFNHKEIVDYINENWYERYTAYDRSKKLSGEWLDEPNVLL